MPVTVFNADDHPILRKGITDLIVESDEFQWVGNAGDGREALEKIKSIRPDVAVLDIEMPYMSGLEVARTLLEDKIPTRFVLLTLFKDASFLRKALEIGVMGYLLKESSEKEILSCLKSVSSGIPFVNASMTQHLLHKPAEKTAILDALTEHEVNILKLIACQKTSLEISHMLFISPKTVSNHRSNISKKLNLDGRQNGLLTWAIEHRDLLK